tara:strand:- start:95 stop:328 length:234 start_codon:yes stop_codon:yes gene_type:complete
MAAKGKAAKSATGASMSKYDVEVEARLKALEAVAHPIPTGTTQQSNDDRITSLEKTVENLIHFIKVQFPKQSKYYND